MVATILGGIGLFLLGMVLLTDGLKAVAGDALRRVLSRFVGGRFSALFSGVAVTALVQSSSATTLTTIGFVSAGLLTFPQAVGVIFGANLGTTSTGWLVSLLGLKLSVSAVALPLVGVGALLRLLTRGRLASLGLALAGFGLIFVGIDTLQAGMKVLATHIDLGAFAAGSVGGRLLLVGVGVVMTVVMQSSSAAVATTLAALHGGAIDLEQAAALVIGQNVGTTVTAAIAAVGASVPAKRTALAHILFNALTGLVAFLVLPVFLGVVDGLVPPGEGHDATAIAGFHTAFNLLGVALFLPFIEPFSRLVTRLVPDRGPALTRHLDRTVADVPGVAVEAARRTVREIARVLNGAALRALETAGRRDQAQDDLVAAEAALEETRTFLARVSGQAEFGGAPQVHVTVLQAMEHLDLLANELREADQAKVAAESPELLPVTARVREGLAAATTWLEAEAAPWPSQLQTFSAELEALRRDERVRLLGLTAQGKLSPAEVGRALEALRWLDRVGHHGTRAALHLSGAAVPAAPQAAERLAG